MNNLQDLNDCLFKELERLNNDEELKDAENLEREMKRSKAVTDLANTIINNARTLLEAQKFIKENGEFGMPKMLIGNDKNKME